MGRNMMKYLPIWNLSLSNFNSATGRNTMKYLSIWTLSLSNLNSSFSSADLVTSLATAQLLLDLTGPRWYIQKIAWSSYLFVCFNPEIRLCSYWICSAKRRRADQRKSCSLKQRPTNHHSGVLSLQQVGNFCANFGIRFLFFLFRRVGHFARNCARYYYLTKLKTSP